MCHVAFPTFVSKMSHLRLFLCALCLLQSSGVSLQGTVGYLLIVLIIWGGGGGENKPEGCVTIPLAAAGIIWHLSYRSIFYPNDR